MFVCALCVCGVCVCVCVCVCVRCVCVCVWCVHLFKSLHLAKRGYTSSSKRGMNTRIRTGLSAWTWSGCIWKVGVWAGREGVVRE